MGFIADDAKEILVILVLALVFGWLFASVLNLFLIGVAIAVLMVVATLISQLIHRSLKNKELNQNFKQSKYDSEKI